MAANPKRKGTSTLPIYLPSMSVPKRTSTGKDDSGESTAPSVYFEGGLDPSAAESLAQELTSGGLEANIEGEMLSALPRRAQLKLRHAVALAARSLAAARVHDSKDKKLLDFPLRGAVDQEEVSLHARTHHQYEDELVPPLPSGVVYDGKSVQAVFRELLAAPGQAANIVATGRVLACWDERANEWVTQAVIPGNPVLVGLGGDAASLAAKVREALAQ
jgi:hypothetical protein